MSHMGVSPKWVKSKRRKKKKVITMASYALQRHLVWRMQSPPGTIKAQYHPLLLWSAGRGKKRMPCPGRPLICINALYLKKPKHMFSNPPLSSLTEDYWPRQRRLIVSSNIGSKIEMGKIITTRKTDIFGFSCKIKTQYHFPRDPQEAAKKGRPVPDPPCINALYSKKPKHPW